MIHKADAEGYVICVRQAEEGPLMGGGQCRLPILRNGNVPSLFSCRF